MRELKPEAVLRVAFRAMKAAEFKKPSLIPSAE
jgi:hypothetical protein